MPLIRGRRIHEFRFLACSDNLRISWGPVGAYRSQKTIWAWACHKPSNTQQGIEVGDRYL